VLSGAMVSMSRLLEKLGPALYSPDRVEGGSAKLNFRFTEFYEVRIALVQTVRGRRGGGEGASEYHIATHNPGEELSDRRRGGHVLGAQHLEKPRRFHPAAGVLGSECPIPVGMLIGGVHSLLGLPQGHREHPAVLRVAEQPVAKVTTLHPERRDDVLFGCAEGLILALWGHGPLAYTGKHTDHHLSPLLRALTLCLYPPECLQQVFCELRLVWICEVRVMAFSEGR
jgi:hypothetical protein